LTLEKNFLYRKIFRGLRETLQLLVSTLEARDVYTKDHAVRVTQYALMMSDILECAPEQREMLEFAGRLHDIGKVGIQDAIMLKPDSLSREEMESMRRHPVISEQIVRPVCLLTEERAVIRNHHEWWNGDGYPDRLTGEEIPLLARILSVADAFDAMTSDRPYRDAMSPQQALCNLEESAGVQFDKDVVEAFRATSAGKRAGMGAMHANGVLGV
jgi:HD-GYP domain-containing protein (c-di-GMP phosphodiesterase class II)